MPVGQKRTVKVSSVTKDIFLLMWNIKFIREYTATFANVHDSSVFEELLDPNCTSQNVWLGLVYRSQDVIERLSAKVTVDFRLKKKNT